MGAPTFWNGVSRGISEMFISVMTGMAYYIILDVLKLLPDTTIGAWMAFLIYLLMVAGVLELWETFLKSKYWTDEYLIGYVVGVAGSAFVISHMGLAPDMMLLLLAIVLMLSFLSRLDRRIKWENWW